MEEGVLMAPQQVTLTANGRALLGAASGAMAIYTHVRAASTLGGGTLSYAYALVDGPSLANAAHWELLEGLAGVLPGQTRPVRWPGTIAAVLAGATSPNVIIDVLVDRC
jgi:hypothetical protein